MITCLNDFISWIAGFESLVFEHITFSALMLFVSYGLVIPLVLLLKRYSYKKLLATLFAVLILFSGLIYEKSQPVNALYVLNKNRQSVMVEHTGEYLAVFHRDSLQLEDLDYQIAPFLDNTQAKYVEDKVLPNYFRFKRNNILVVDRSGVYKIPHLEPDYIILTESAPINLDRLIERYPNTTIIADASNFRSYVERWKVTCSQKNIPFHSTYEKGYYKF